MNPAHRFVNLAFAVSLAVLDATMVYCAFRLAAKLQRVRDTRIPPEGNIPAISFAWQITLVSICVVGAFLVFGLYIRRRGISKIDLLFSLFQALLVGFGVALAVSSLLGVELSRATFLHASAEGVRPVMAELARSTMVWWAVMSLGLIWTARVVLDQLTRTLRRRGFDLCNVLIVGSGPPGKMVLEKMRHAPELGYRVVGFVDDYPVDQIVDGVPVLGTRRELIDLVDKYRVSELILAAPELTLRDRLDLVTSLARRPVNIKVVPDIFEIMASEVASSDLTGLPMMQVRDVALRGWNLQLKRGLDLMVSGVSLILVSPLLMLIALLIKLGDRREPVFYTQERVGLDGKPFQIVKFRSMPSDAEAESGPVWTRRDDPRRTRLGAFLRRWSLDELPQLINVLAGEMSLVGPRPERPHFVRQFSAAIPRYAHRHTEKAGLTGHAQVHGLRGDTSVEERTTYDVYYVERWSLAFDLKILLKTIGAVFRDRNAY